MKQNPCIYLYMNLNICSFCSLSCTLIAYIINWHEFFSLPIITTFIPHLVWFDSLPFQCWWPWTLLWYCHLSFKVLFDSHHFLSWWPYRHPVYYSNLFSSLKLIRFPAFSILRTLTSTLWPSCNWVLFILEVWISPSLPTPMSTKAPKWVTLVTFPVNIVPSRRLAMSRIPSLNSGFSCLSVKFKINISIIVMYFLVLHCWMFLICFGSICTCISFYKSNLWYKLELNLML